MLFFCEATVWNNGQSEKVYNVVSSASVYGVDAAFLKWIKDEREKFMESFKYSQLRPGDDYRVMSSKRYPIIEI